MEHFTNISPKNHSVFYGRYRNTWRFSNIYPNKNHPDFHNNGGAGLVYHLSSPVVKGVSSTPSIFINLPMRKRWEKDIYGFPSTMQHPRFRHPHRLPNSALRRCKELGGKLMSHPRHDVCRGAGIQVTQNVLDDFLVS